MKRRSIAVTAACAVVIASCHLSRAHRAPARAPAAATFAKTQEVMTSAFCARCHPAIFAEHAQNTHGRAFTDEEVRLATGHFDHGDCIRCHTPRPIFETGIGMNPMRRHTNLVEGNTCMTCHWRTGVDYSTFEGGTECKTAFDDRVGAVEACASCHRNHGTPYQWEKAPTGKRAKRRCITCHMPMVHRPVAVGEPAREVRSHVYPGSRSEHQLRRAYRYDAHIDGNEVVVEIENKGAGHNFPTELKQRALESLVVVRDDSGAEVARSRMVFRDPYKRPYGLKLPVNTQIPAGESRQHRVPLQVANGTVDCQLHFKLYYPIEDNHPDLARQLEERLLPFAGVTPSDAEVITSPEVRVHTPESISAESASPAQLVDYARPPIGTVEIKIPSGATEDDIRKLIEMFQFPVPQGNAAARDRLVEIGAPAVPALIEALGSWDNKTWKQSIQVLTRIGAPAMDAAIAALASDQLYVRIHARQLVSHWQWGDRTDELAEALRRDLTSPHALDRAGSAHALAAVGDVGAAPSIRPLLTDPDPDVRVAAAQALAQFDDRESLPAVEQALREAYFDESRRALAEAAASLGSAAGIPVLLAGLDNSDDLLREDDFESFFAVTGIHLGYDPQMPRPERLEAISRLQQVWAERGGAALLRRPPQPDRQQSAQAWRLVQRLGTGAGTGGGDDAALVEELVLIGDDAVPALVLGLKFPPGFDAKRARICEALGRIGNREAAPALAATLRDPVVLVAAWACWALERTGDPATLTALARYQDRLLSLQRAGAVPARVGPPDRLLVQVARSRLLLGDDAGEQGVIAALLSEDLYTRELAIDALYKKYGERRGYDPSADLAERRAAAARWTE